ncbi:capsular polysaccharide export system inner membrane protein KpsE [Bosea sp. BIWAKO-01]|nr:capsular polysaccharide export system inner membrane protein KpsE [Bosea sp. BIWAKO-01]
MGQLVAAKIDQTAIDRAAGAINRPFAGPRPILRRLSWKWLLFFLPTLLAAIYYGPIASDRYVSEAQIVVRRASDQGPTGGFASFLKSTGLGGPDDVNVVQAYVLSRDAVRALQNRLPIKTIFGPQGADFIARWPSLIYGASEEELYRYYLTMVTAAPSHQTGVLTISVQAFEPAQARAIAAALVDLAEAMVNRLNERAQSEGIKSANEEVERSEQALIASQVALTQFRNRELILDPERNAVLLSDLIGKLNTELAGTLAQIAQLRESAPNNPQLGPLNAHAQSLKQQIESQRNVVSSVGSGLADKVSEYERLNLQQQFATRRLATAIATLTVAKAQARRQQIFLERIVEPNLPDKSTRPQRMVNFLTVFGWSLLFCLIFWVVGAGVREHAASHSS